MTHACLPAIFAISLTLTVGAKAGETSSKKSIPSAKAIDSGKASLPPTVLGARPRAKWTLGAGIQWRNIGSIRFTSARSSFSTPNPFGSDSLTLPAGIGAESGFDNRTYEDGFVFPDGRTASTGRTTYYEYKNASQLTTNTLSYSATGGERRTVSASSTIADPSWNEGRDWEAAPYLKLSYLSPRSRNGWRLGPTFHFSFTNIDGKQRGITSISGSEQLDVSNVSIRDAYDTTGLALFPAPYTGAPDISAPFLPAEPTRSVTETPSNSESATWNDSINQSFDLDLWGVSLGAQAIYQNNGPLYASIGAGLVMNVSDWNARRSDTLFQSLNGTTPIAVASSNTSDSDTEILFGAYVEISAGYLIGEALSLESTLRYDWNEDLTGSVGSDSFEVDLSGFSIGLGMNYFF